MISNQQMMRESPIERIYFLTRIVWVSPNTLLGLIIGGVGMCFGGRARIRGCAIEFYNGGTKWFIQHLPYGQFTLALTLGHTILGQTAASLDIARKHETVHILQYERWGPFFTCLFSFLNLYLANRSSVLS